MGEFLEVHRRNLIREQSLATLEVQWASKEGISELPHDILRSRSYRFLRIGHD